MSDAHLMEFPYFDLLVNARLDTIYHDEETHEFVMDFYELQLDQPIRMFWEDGKPFEELHGQYIPRRIRFHDVKWVEAKGIYADLTDIPLDHSARFLQGALYWKPTHEEDTYFLLSASSSEYAKLMMATLTNEVSLEERSGETETAHVVRNWSPTPPWTDQFMPETNEYQEKYGGDPIRFLLNGEMCADNFLVGGTHHQGEQRSPVHAILNLSEEPSAWLNDSTIPFFDRWAHKGEGRDGMTTDEMITEAKWVTKRLREGQRVLVHCSAGFNRSVTVCCAALILMENLSAEEALNRVREQHPWSRPDAYNWLKLKWLAHSLKERA